VTGSVLSPAETRAVSALLTGALGSRTEVCSAEPIWDRKHVLRLRVRPDRSVILKRRREREDGFGAELAALEYLNAMPAPVAPRLVAADAQAGLLLMQDLGPGASLADALLAGDREQARTGLVSYAQALGAMHAWSMGRPAALASLRARYAPQAPPSPAWLGAVGDGRDAFVGAMAALGLAIDGADGEIEELSLLLNGTGYLGLVHGDACPDNVRFLADGCRIFDFEMSGWGPIAMDAAYLLAPFPSCWCFASLPADVVTPAMDAYRAVVQTAGIDLGPDWEVAMTAAMAAWVVFRGETITRVLDDDQEWGTTTLRPRLLTWLRSFTDAAGRTGVLPRLRALADALHDELRSRWPETVTAAYPALAGPGSARVEVPEWWRPGL
jgi:Ser/Thr protein kinase RdoA (MazF antagonist)